MPVPDESVDAIQGNGALRKGYATLPESPGPAARQPGGEVAAGCRRNDPGRGGSGFTLATKPDTTSCYRSWRARYSWHRSFIQAALCLTTASGCRTTWAACKSALRTA